MGAISISVAVTRKTVIMFRGIIHSMTDERTVSLHLSTGERIYGVQTHQDREHFYLYPAVVLDGNLLVETSFAVVKKEEVVRVGTPTVVRHYGVDLLGALDSVVEREGSLHFTWGSVVKKPVYVRCRDFRCTGIFSVLAKGKIVLDNAVEIGEGKEEYSNLQIEDYVYVAARSDRRIYLDVKARKRRGELNPISVVTVG
jgi:hypothetical protein